MLCVVLGLRTMLEESAGFNVLYSRLVLIHQIKIGELYVFMCKYTAGVSCHVTVCFISLLSHSESESCFMMMFEIKKNIKTLSNNNIT